MTELEEICNNYFKDVYFFIYSLSKNEPIAEALTSETFIKAIESTECVKENCVQRDILHGSLILRLPLCLKT